MRILLSFLIVMFTFSAAEARVFSITQETFAAYFNGSAGTSSLADAPFSGEAGSSVTYSDQVKYNYTGEFGVLYSSPRVSFRFGMELLKPKSLEGVVANDGSNDIYSANSEMLGYVPKIGVEFNLENGQNYRSFLSATFGSANITLKNSYSLTAAGQTAFPSVAAQHDVEGKGSATLMAAGLGYEGLFTDTTTVVVEFGYRKLTFDNMQYAKSTTTFSGAQSSGSDLLTSSGEKRVFDFSGAYISLGFRFYL